MKNITTLGLTLLCCFIASAQSDTTFYFAENGSACTKQNAASYRNAKLVDEASQRYNFEDYTIDGTLTARGSYLRDVFRNRIGTYTEYYKNGNRKLRGTYLTDVNKGLYGQQVNTWYWWYENGNIQLEKLYALDTATGAINSFIVNFWDTAGVKKVEESNGEYLFTEEWGNDSASKEEITFTVSVKYGQFDGVLKGFYADGTLFCEETYANEGQFIKGISYDRNGQSYTYTQKEAMPEFRGGDPELMRFLNKNIKYPQKERDDDIEGRVLIAFVVDNNGKVKDVRVVRSVTPGLDNEALRVVKLLPDFKPATYRGQGVSVHYSIPVVFRLQ